MVQEEWIVLSSHRKVGGTCSLESCRAASRIRVLGRWTSSFEDDSAHDFFLKVAFHSVGWIQLKGVVTFPKDLVGLRRWLQEISSTRSILIDMNHMTCH